MPQTKHGPDSCAIATDQNAVHQVRAELLPFTSGPDFRLGGDDKHKGVQLTPNLHVPSLLIFGLASQLRNLLVRVLKGAQQLVDIQRHAIAVLLLQVGSSSAVYPPMSVSASRIRRGAFLGPFQPHPRRHVVNNASACVVDVLFRPASAAVHSATRV
jgi:hypothetical protein